MSAQASRRYGWPIRLLCIALTLCFLLIYIEWGARGEFIFQMAGEVLRNGSRDSLTHPLVLGPAGGLLVLLLAAFVPRMPRLLIAVALAGPGVLALLVLIAGLSAGNLRMIVFVLPFLSALLLLVLRLLRPGR